MMKDKIPDELVTSEESKQNEKFMKLMKNESNHENAEYVETDGQNPLNSQTTKRGNENETDGQNPPNSQTSKRRNKNQQADDNTKFKRKKVIDSNRKNNLSQKRKENYDALIAKKEELTKEICVMAREMKKAAESSMRLKRENKKLLRELKENCSKDDISKLEAMNPDGNSLLDDDEKDYQTSPESSGEFNICPDCSMGDKEGDSDTLMEKK